MADTNRVGIRIVDEGSSFGVLPTTPDLLQLPYTGTPGLAFIPVTTTSNRIRDDRQISDLPLVGGEAAGDVGGELCYEAWDAMKEAALQGTFQARYSRENRTTSGNGITAVTTTQFTVDADTTPLVNDIVRAEGFGNATNDGFHIVNGSPSTTACPVATTLVADASPASTARLKKVGHRGAAGDIDMDATAGNHLTSTILNLNDSILDLNVGDWIKLAGFTAGDVANNGYYRVSAIAVNQLTFDRVPTGFLAATPVGAVDIYLAERLVNGIAQRSFSIEQTFNGTTPDDPTYNYLRGMTVDSYALSATPQEIVTETLTFSGKDAIVSDATVPTTEFSVDGTGRATGAVNLQAYSSDVLNSSSNVGTIARGNTPITGANFVLEATIETSNNLRQRNAVGFLGAVSIGSGEFSVTGTLNAYFDNADLYREVLNNTESSFDMQFQDSASHSVIYDLPRIKWSEGAPDVPGKNEDVVQNLAYQAILDPEFGYTMAYFRFTGVQ